MRRADPPMAILVRGKDDPIFITRPEVHIARLVAQGWRLLIKDSDLKPSLTSPHAEHESGESQLD